MATHPASFLPTSQVEGKLTLQPDASYLDDLQHPMTYLYTAGACILLAQIIGIYALFSRKADLVFSVMMIVAVIAAVGFAYGGYHALR